MPVALCAPHNSRAIDRCQPDPTQPPVTDLTSNLTQIALDYQQRLRQNPRDAEALTGMSLVALASHQDQAAVAMAQAGASAAPHSPLAWVALGQALKASEHLEPAELAYRQAIRLDGINALAHMGLGELLIAITRPAEAVREFELALQQRPTLAAAHLGLGNALAFLGLDQEALDSYEQALTYQPELPEAHFAAGFALARLGRTEQAEARYRRAVSLRPDFAAAWVNLGSLLREQGKDIYAEAALRQAIALRPDLVSGWVNLAILERERNRPRAAEAYLRKAFALNPSQVETLIAWCQFRVAERDLHGAWQWLRWAQARQPDHDEAANMEGILLHTEERFEEAIAAFERAEALGSRGAASNRGNSLLDMGCMDESLRAHELAVERDPTHPGAQYNLALTQLRLGDWQQGWPGYEARWRFREVHRNPRQFSQPRWQGEDIQGRRILLHAEQGLGDTIQFCRYAALVAARGGRPILEVQRPVERLMHSLSIVSFGQAEVRVLGAQRVAEDFDFECPLMSLPAIFRTTVDTVPWPGAYLGADPAVVQEKLAQFPSINLNPRIGLAWSGNPRYKADHKRSTRLDTFLPLVRAVPANWISLQKGDAAQQQLAALPDDVTVRDGCSHDCDLADAAALIATLDIVITTDTSIGHLAGAMGKPVWIMLPHLADWRWMQGIETTPWYPTARLFRQATPGDWAELLTRVMNELR